MGAESLVCQLSKGSNDDVTVPFAEFWLGCHPNGVNHVVKSDNTTVTINEFIKEHTDFFSANATKNEQDFASALPFLLKVLAIGRPLSIQSHPDKKTAELLHGTRGDVYKDDNHKPEVAVALSDDFEALCGFRPWADIAHNLNKYPQFRSLLGEEYFLSHASQLNSPSTASSADIVVAIRQCLSSILKTSKLTNEQLSLSMLKLPTDCNEHTCYEMRLFRELHHHFPGDVGCWTAFLLNNLKLQKGESLFIGPNTLHVYLKGDCIECMANSDNVIRGGLTPKFKDVDLLLDTLEFAPSPTPHLRAVDVPCHVFGHASVVCYIPPVQEFKIFKIQIGQNSSVKLCMSEVSASVFIVIEGETDVVDESESMLFVSGHSGMVRVGAEIEFSTRKSEVLIFAASSQTDPKQTK